MLFALKMKISCYF